METYYILSISLMQMYINYDVTFSILFVYKLKMYIILNSLIRTRTRIELVG